MAAGTKSNQSESFVADRRMLLSARTPRQAFKRRQGGEPVSFAALALVRRVSFIIS